MSGVNESFQKKIMNISSEKEIFKKIKSVQNEMDQIEYKETLKKENKQLKKDCEKLAVFINKKLYEHGITVDSSDFIYEIIKKYIKE